MPCPVDHEPIRMLLTVAVFSYFHYLDSLLFSRTVAFLSL